MPARIRKTLTSGHALSRVPELASRNHGVNTGRSASQDSMPPPARTWAPGEWLLFIVLLLGGALFLFLLARPLRHGSVYTLGDMGLFPLPLRQFYADCLARADNFPSTPSLFSGYYVHAAAQVGISPPRHP